MLRKNKLTYNLNKLNNLYVSNKRSLLRYLIIGITAVVADNCVFIIAYQICNGSLLLATVLALSIGFFVSFLGNKLWVFNANQQTSAHRPVKQLIFYSLLFIFNIIFTFYFIDIMEKQSINAIVSKILTTVLITTWNYILYKKVIFKQK
jgi:putative flippase GtrA